MVAVAASSPGLQDQSKLLEEAIAIVKVQAFHMKRTLDAHKLMDALKHCSTMLAELRTSSLTPKNYYELYMAIFDELRHLNTYLYDAHMSHRHHLSDLYELVQYAGNIVPRLYLMITVGSVYMRVSKELIPQGSFANGENNNLSTENGEGEDGHKAVDQEDVPPIKELMKDMLEMSRGVQHPTRGLFLRYYLSGMTRDFLPDGLVDGPHGTIHDSIQFILQNFIEMNKLWVRLQHQGHSREREKREQERKELRLLVGSSLVRLSQLEALDLETYKTLVLPSILEEIVSCKDVIAQEYLMEVIIQVFQDDFHLRTLDAFLSATAQLQRSVNVKQIVISLIDRFASYAARARDESAEEKPDNTEEKTGTPSGIPEDVQLFDVFWRQITDLIKARPEFTIQDVVALLVSLCNLSLNCYPEQLDYVDKVLGYTKEKVVEAQTAKSPELRNSKTVSSLLQLLLGPIQAYHSNVLTILQFPSSVTQHDGAGSSLALAGNYADLLFLQPYSTRRQVAHAFASTALRAFNTSGFIIDSEEGVNAVFGEVCSVMVREQNDGGLFGPKSMQVDEERGPKYAGRQTDEELPLDWEDVLEEQNMIAKLVHLVKTRTGNAEKEFALLSTARKHFGEGGDIRIRFTLPPLIIALIRLGRKYRTGNEEEDEAASEKLSFLFKFIHQTISSMSKAREHFGDDYDADSLFKDDNPGPSNSSKIGSGLMAPPEMSLRLNLMAATAADEAGFEELSYEFFVQAFTVYEESISESKAQLLAITLIIGSLYSTSVFGYENYETLITKAAVHCSRLLKRVDQCRALMLVSHLFWGDDTKPRDDTKPVYRDGRRVMECLQKALKIADTVMEKNLNVELFVEVLERYVWYFEKRNNAVTVKYLNSIIDLIQTNLSSIDAARSDVPSLSRATSYAPGPLSPAGSTGSLFDDDATRNKLSESVLKHYQNVMEYLKAKKDEDIDAGGGGGQQHVAGVPEGMGSAFADTEVRGQGSWRDVTIATTR
ncbi:vacuolar protein sorting-associated protein 35 [Fimicolochytrium jonesii]|uniref:vacuolar protein sorting-associated protein 35 n=1 Tax=Fimicolochytrium jonesii TaxID=1396493 RepID=UPI0022FE2D29|nr:vacuolar protein sorting-associated protein 35 [Fimicolochytrium jonesii]KAI8818650.1 vacuolar protein sorting-associated protein 35 [Fimicolochytrium jonesii]